METVWVQSSNNIPAADRLQLVVIKLIKITTVSLFLTLSKEDIHTYAVSMNGGEMLMILMIVFIVEAYIIINPEDTPFLHPHQASLRCQNYVQRPWLFILHPTHHQQLETLTFFITRLDLSPFSFCLCDQTRKKLPDLLVASLLFALTPSNGCRLQW